jgi:pimeloyl-ACP methyl ester carboxylesterase
MRGMTAIRCTCISTCCLFLLIACGGTSVRTVHVDDWLQRPVVYDHERHLPSVFSSHLAYLGLSERFATDPWTTLDEVDRSWRALVPGNDAVPPREAERRAVVRRGLSYVYAAGAYHLASRLGEDPRKPAAMATAMVAAYTFLFEPTLAALPQPPEALDERTNDAREIYNRSVAWLALWQQQHGPARAEQRILPLLHGSLTLTRGDYQLPFPLADARRFDTTFALRADGLELPVIQRGLGAPMVVRFEQKESAANLVCAATYLIRLDHFPTTGELLTGQWQILDPLRSRTHAAIPGQPPLRLEADLTTPLQVFAAELPDSHRSTGFFDGSTARHLAGLTMMEPYVPGRIPVIVVHGTLAVPEAWLPFFAGLRGDPWLSGHFQLWFFRYPTSNPIPVSAAILRDAIAAQVKRLDPEGKDPALKRMVLMGHSMGGLLARLQVIDSDPGLRAAIAPDLKPEQAASPLLTRCTDFRHNERITRVVYIGTPHRGVDMLDAFWLNDASDFLDLPQESADLAAFVGDHDEHTSIQTMRPGCRFLTWLDSKPIGTGVVVHSILGDLGKGDDGLVFYKSAHLDGVASELVLPVDHGKIYKDSAAVRELRRILEEHLAAP